MLQGNWTSTRVPSTIIVKEVQRYGNKPSKGSKGAREREQQAQTDKRRPEP